MFKSWQFIAFQFVHNDTSRMILAPSVPFSIKKLLFLHAYLQLTPLTSRQDWFHKDKIVHTNKYPSYIFPARSP